MFRIIMYLNINKTASFKAFSKILYSNKQFCNIWINDTLFSTLRRGLLKFLLLKKGEYKMINFTNSLIEIFLNFNVKTIL